MHIEVKISRNMLEDVYKQCWAGGLHNSIDVIHAFPGVFAEDVAEILRQAAASRAGLHNYSAVVV